jgi:hypothetical protein
MPQYQASRDPQKIFFLCGVGRLRRQPAAGGRSWGVRGEILSSCFLEGVARVANRYSADERLEARPQRLRIHGCPCDAVSLHGWSGAFAWFASRSFGDSQCSRSEQLAELASTKPISLSTEAVSSSPLRLATAVLPALPLAVGSRPPSAAVRRMP